MIWREREMSWRPANGKLGPRGQIEIRKNLLMGIGLGLFVATGFSIWVTLLRAGVGREPFEAYNTSWGRTVVIYYVGFIIGGSLLGLLWPLRRRAWGAILIGFVGVFPMYMGVTMLRTEPVELYPTALIAATILSLVVGGGVALQVWSEERTKSRGT